MTNVRAVKDALQSLTARTDDEHGQSTSTSDRRHTRSAATDGANADPAAVVDEAAAAVRDVETAAAFVAQGGCARLRRAVRVAEKRGEHRVASRGRATLQTIGRYRRTANGTSTETVDADTGDAHRHGDDGEHATGRRGTVLNADSQRPDI